jgi:hypothetical protein
MLISLAIVLKEWAKTSSIKFARKKKSLADPLECLVNTLDRNFALRGDFGVWKRRKKFNNSIRG